MGCQRGVFNLVTGRGSVVGEALALHPDVDMISFTGSTNAGRRVSELASRTVKPVALELGGKSANILLDDADFETAVRDGVGKCFLNTGQTCSALTRMLVPRSKLAEAEEIAKRLGGMVHAGRPFTKGTRLGPLVSADQQETVTSYIRKGEQEGAKLVTGGAEPPEGLEKGYFVRPTVFSDVTSEMAIAQEEIFGPVLVIMPTRTRTTRCVSPTIASMASRAASGRATASGRCGWRGGSARARWRSTAARSTCWRPSAATSSQATGAS